jgi:hypothetical protein
MAHASTAQAHTSTSSIVNFITRSGTTLYDGTTPFRFLGWDSASHTFFCDGNDPFEQQDFFKAAQQTGATVVRTMPWLVGYNPVGGPNNVNGGSPECFHITNPQTGVYNENMWRTIDQGIAYANQYGIRIMFPFVFGAHWNQDSYTVDGWAKFFNANYTETDFYTNPTIIQSFENFLSWVLNRTNTVTGVQYKNDPTIFCWETGNELEDAPDSWSSTIAAYLKSLDHNHLVCDGNHSSTGSIDSNSLNDPNLDVIDRHYYGSSQISTFQNDISVVQGYKPLVVGEWGFMDYADSKTMIDTTVNNPVVAGSLLWALDEHSRNGGFILNGSLNSVNGNAGYRWPGFASGNAYDETSILNYQRSQAYAIRGLSVPPVTAPDAPTLLPTNSANVIQWQGSVGASSYALERATSSGGPFSSIATGLRDDQEALYNDTTAVSGQSYYYRLTATNSGGTSGYSNVIGPITAQGQAVHLDAGGPGTGTSWSADVDWHETGGTGGTTNCNCTVSTTGVAKAAPASVYQTERWGAAFSYIFNGLTANTNYTVRLHYAETDGYTTGQRQFNVYINNGQVESNLDVYAAVGADKAMVRDYTATANSSGQISVWFTSGAAKVPDIRGVEVLPLTSGNGGTLFSSGFESGDPQPTWSDTVDTGPGYGGNINNVGGICCGLTGPQASERTNEYAHTGNTALMYSGMANSATSAHAYMKIFDLSASAITVSPGTMLSYWIYPESQNNSIGGSYVSGNNSTCVAIDMIFSDGSTLRDSGAQDQYGNSIHPSKQCNHLTLDTWNHVSVNLGAYVNGKTINRIDVGYDQAGQTGGYRGYVDDILINNSSS